MILGEGTVHIHTAQWGIVGEIIIHTCNVLSVVVFVACYIGPGTFVKMMRKK